MKEQLSKTRQLLIAQEAKCPSVEMWEECAKYAGGRVVVETSDMDHRRVLIDTPVDGCGIVVVSQRDEFGIYRPESIVVLRENGKIDIATFYLENTSHQDYVMEEGGVRVGQISLQGREGNYDLALAKNFWRDDPGLDLVMGYGAASVSDWITKKTNK